MSTHEKAEVFIKLIKEEILHKGFITLKEMWFRLNSGLEVSREIIEAKDSVTFLMVDKKRKKILLNRQPRPIPSLFHDFDLLEVPAGMIDEGETPLEALIREAEEETKIKVHQSDVSFVHYSYHEVARIKGINYLHLVHFDSSLVKTGIYHGEVDEEIESVLIDFSQLEEILAKGERIREINSKSACYFLLNLINQGKI